ncbi:Flavinator of succinate dehydrogenase-domain-containing protein [Kalaharituber pfeilii]|nr:Flavinator of succinate dehydrogenase-domain-containing protein [Kalaharituber pfeilii]
MLARTLRISRPAGRSLRTSSVAARPFTSRQCLLKDPYTTTEDESYAHSQTAKPLNPHLTNTTSTIRPDSHHPTVGAHNVPPEFISSVDSSFNPKDTHDPAYTQHLTGGTQDGLGPKSSPPGSGMTSDSPAKTSPQPTYQTDTDVLSHLNSSFTVNPLPRDHEDAPTMRARLLYQSRKRGILETDLLLSTFADENLHKMSPEQLKEYDKFLDENDWDIYYWCTQTVPTTSAEYAEGGSKFMATEAAQGQNIPGTTPTSRDSISSDATPSDPQVPQNANAKPLLAAGMDSSRAGEWAQTIGKKREPYRRPPERWINSDILKMIRCLWEEGIPGGINEQCGR